MLKKLVLILVPALMFIIGLVAIPKLSAVGNNLIANPSVETAANNLPVSWNTSQTTGNTSTFSYLNTGHTGSHSLQTKMTARRDGRAMWVFSPVSVAPHTKYTFTDWYQSTANNGYLVTVTKTTGATSTIVNKVLPTSAAWKQGTVSFTTPAKASSLIIQHYINRVGQLTTDDVDLEGPAGPTAPTVALTAPAANTTVAGAQTVSATATDTKGVTNVQFQLDGVNLGAADKTSPYSVSWNTAAAANGNHVLTAIATNNSNLKTTSAPITVNVQNIVTPPVVNLTGPANGSNVSGPQTITATATDAKGISSVQFQLDGVNLGAADTTSPYSIAWDTTQVANGNHVLSAIAKNTSNLTTTSSPVTVNVQNVVTPPNPTNGPNLILNPSLESSASGTAPDSWLFSNWGTNTSTSSYLNTGHTGTHSLKVQTTSWTNGAANWYYADIPVTAGTTYQYSNWYQSNVDTEVDAEVTMTDGTVNYYYLGTVLANTNWTKFTTTFTPPAGAKSMAVYQILAKVGYIVSDDYSLNTYTPLPFNRGIVSVSFDDGWANQYANAYPLLQQYGIPATFNIISGELTDQPDYMSLTQVKTLLNSGNEIASHSVTHPDLTTLTQAQMVQEMQQSQATLQNALGIAVTDFAYPFGAYNTNTLTVGKQYYQSQRTVNAGYNTKDNLDLTQLKIYEVDSNISQAQVQGWINGAIAQKSWLILVYHEIAVTPTDPTDALYDTQPSDLNAELAYIHNSGVAAETVHQAINEILPQL
jgi:peptidoglycan/xylan/chitin deacetylase (PgdA/CDA1 family)